jgi:hypothetical protein
LPYLHEIKEKFTFYGVIPHNNDNTEKHLAISLLLLYGNIKYCYVQSDKPDEILHRYSDRDFIFIDKKYMIPYFPDDYRDSHIFISSMHIISIMNYEVLGKITAKEFEERHICNDELFHLILEGIKGCSNLPQRFINDLVDEIEKSLRL